MEVHVKCLGVENEWVVITPDSLPENPYDAVSLLKTEYAPRHTWLELASLYFDRGEWQSGIAVLEQATNDNVETFLKSAGAESTADPNAPRCSRLDLLAALGGAYIMLADAQVGDPPEREETLSKAREIFSRADHIDFDSSPIWVARGWADFLAGKTSSAKEWFDNARGKQVVMGSLGLAALQLNKLFFVDPEGAAQAQREDYRIDPVELLTQALRSSRCPPGVWTGLAHALFREHKLDLARDVAERAVHATRFSGSAERREALYVLARIEMADKKNLDVTMIAAALREAYVKCGGSKDARVLALLAEFNLKRNYLDIAEVFAREAVSRAHDAPGASIGAMYAGVHRNIYVQALFQHGRVLHHLNKTEEATKVFEKIKAIADSPEGEHMKINYGVYLRLGMLKLSTCRMEDETVAEECLEKVVKNNDYRVFAAFRALGFLLGRREIMKIRRGKVRDGEVYDRAIALLKKGITMEKKGADDIPAQLVYAALHEEKYPKIALEAYQQVVAVSKLNKLDVDVAVHVNIASLLARMNRPVEAQAIFDNVVDDSQLEPARPIINYNRGRIAEMLDDDEQAKSFYEKLSPEDMPYWEAQVRLALIAKTQNKLDEAEELFRTAMKDSYTRSVAATYLSKLLTSQKKFKAAQDLLEQNRNDCDFLALSFAQFMHRFLDSVGTRERRKRFLINHVGVSVLNVLKKSKNNAFAVNGVGVYFAESEMYDEAREAFTAAGSCKPLCHAARMNLAHVNIHDGKHLARNAYDNIGRPDLNVLALAKSKFQQAEKLYTDALALSIDLTEEKGYKWRNELRLYLGCAQFESRDYADAVESFQQVVMFCPSSNVSWYNLGVSLYESGVARLKEKKDLDSVLKGMGELVASKRCLKMSMSIRPKQVDVVAHRPFEKKLAEHWYLFVRQEAIKHKTTEHNARNEHEDKLQKIREKEEFIKRVHKEREEKKQRELEKEEEEKRRVEAIVRSTTERLLLNEENERLNKLNDQRANKRRNSYEEDDPERPATKPKRRKRKSEPTMESDTEMEPRKRKSVGRGGKKGRSRLARTGGDSSSDEYHDEDVMGEMDAMLGEGSGGEGNSKGGEKRNRSTPREGSPNERAGSRAKGRLRKIASDSDSDGISPMRD